MITQRTNQRPSGDVPVDAPKPLMQPRISVANPGQIRGRRKHTEAAIVLQRKILTKGTVELAWRVVAGPDRVVIHADRHHLARKAHLCPRPPSAPQVVDQLPRTKSAYYRKNERPAGLEETRAFTRHIAKIWNTIERAQI